MGNRNTKIRSSQIENILPEDIDATNSLVDNYVPSYDLATGKFTWITVAGGISNLPDLTDVVFDTGTPSDNQVLTYDSATGKWKAETLSIAHNDTTDKQGGTTNEYYHLTSADYTELHNWLDNVILGSDGKLTLLNGTDINEFSTDGTLAGNSDDAVPTEKAVKTYADTKSIKHISINTQTDNYTLVLGDDGKLIDMNKATAVTLTVPKNSVVAFPTGTTIAIRQKGAGQVTITPVDGTVTIDSQDGLITTAQHAMASILKVATDTWVAVGSLESA